MNGRMSHWIPLSRSIDPRDRKFNDNHDELGRFSSDGGPEPESDPTTPAAPAGGPTEGQLYNVNHLGQSHWPGASRIGSKQRAVLEKMPYSYKPFLWAEVEETVPSEKESHIISKLPIVYVNTDMVKTPQGVDNTRMADHYLISTLKGDRYLVKTAGWSYARDVVKLVPVLSHPDRQAKPPRRW